MKKIAIWALVLGGVALLGSCSGNKSEQSEDSNSIELTEVEEGLYTDSVAALFRNPDLKSEVATDSTYAETSTGLKYLVITEGTGERPTATDRVTVHYTGKLLDGTIFDSSVQRGEPATFGLNQVIKGWTEGVQLMKEGSKYVFYIPTDLAYGAQGAPGAIPAYADLVFEVELIKIEK